MQAVLDIDDLLEYTDWERQQWLEWFRLHGAASLEISAGPHGDGRFGNSVIIREVVGADALDTQRHRIAPLMPLPFCLSVKRQATPCTRRSEMPNDHAIRATGIAIMFTQLSAIFWSISVVTNPIQISEFG